MPDFDTDAALEDTYSKALIGSRQLVRMHGLLEDGGSVLSESANPFGGDFHEAQHEIEYHGAVDGPFRGVTPPEVGCSRSWRASASLFGASCGPAGARLLYVPCQQARCTAAGWVIQWDFVGSLAGNATTALTAVVHATLGHAA